MKPIVGRVVIFFGAGASLGGARGHVTPEPPPLMAELYERLAQRFPSTWGPSSERGRRRDAYISDFEKTFIEHDLGRRPDLPPGTPGAPGLSAIEAQRPVAVYFSEFKMDGTRRDLYSRLLSFLTRSSLLNETFFATVNYESLFEQAAHYSGLQMSHLLEAATAVLRGTVADDWPGERRHENQVFLAKLHGSAHFKVAGNDHQRLRALLASTGTHVETGITVMDPFLSIPEHEQGSFPIMTQTSPDRGDFLSPAQILQLRQIWQQAVKNASLVAIIGASPRRYDSHIWESIERATGRVVHIGSVETLKAWRVCNPNVVQLSDDFANGFRPLLKCLALYRKNHGGGALAYLLDLWRVWRS